MRRTLEKKLKSWFVAPSSGVHLDLVDGLRGVAILLVVACHGLYISPTKPNALDPLIKVIQSGWVGVRLFFVLSGFLIALPFFQKRQNDLQFWHAPGYALRRFLKIIPPFYLAIVLFLAYYLWRYRDPIYIKTGLCWATGIAHFVPMPVNFNLSFWSLWVEAGFYVALPLLFFLTRGLDAKKTGWALFWTLLILPTVVRELFWKEASSGVTVIINNSFPKGLDNFAWGVWFASFYTTIKADASARKRLARLGYVGTALLAASCWVFSVSPGFLSPRMENELEHHLPGVSAFLMLFIVFDSECRLGHFFSASWLRFFGVISYEWFLLHQPIQNQFGSWVGGANGSPLIYIVKFVVPTVFSLILSVAIYQVFSLPILRWGRNKTRASARKVEQGAASAST
jgi:peptidoglycan/LPS O-acetylase OafA/YrhL